MTISEKDLNEGEVECSKCLGAGEILPKKSHFGVLTCPKCNGRGKLDWIENIMGMRWSNIWFSADPDGAVDLYYAGNKILETTVNGGVRVYMPTVGKV